MLAVILQRQLANHSGSLGHATAFSHTFLWARGLSMLAVIPALLLPRRPHQRDKPDTAPAPESPARRA